MMFVGDAQTFQDMVSKIKAIMSRGMTGNPAMMFGGMQAASQSTTVATPQVSQPSAVPKFMMMKDDKQVEFKRFS